jgi:preprotein translocase subunit Sec63
MMKKIFKLTPNQTVFMKLVSLPISVHKMRIKNFVIVQEVNDATVLQEMNKYIIVNNIPNNASIEETNEVKEEKKSRKNNKQE